LLESASIRTSGSARHVVSHSRSHGDALASRAPMVTDYIGKLGGSSVQQLLAGALK
jgi:hypothetical protein